MKNTRLSAAIALLYAPAVLAQATTTFEASTATTTAAPSCTASLITTLCDYKDPGPEFAVAIDSRASCWQYCNDHQPCDFVIFAAGNPNTGTGTCWAYPGEEFDESAGENSSCGSPYLSVYSKPDCGPSTPTSGACAATASPSAIASVCEYPEPDDCFYTCYASEGAPNCLGQCADAESCSYAIFKPHTPSNSPYASGTCWIYTNGTYDAASAGTCSGKPEQFVYENPCPQAPASSSSPSSSSSSSSSSSPVPSATASPNDDETETAGQYSAVTSITPGAAPVGFSFNPLLAIGMAGIMWHGIC